MAVLNKWENLWVRVIGHCSGPSECTDLDHVSCHEFGECVWDDEGTDYFFSLFFDNIYYYPCGEERMTV